MLVFGGEVPRNINQHVRPGSATATQAIMYGLANTIAVIGVNNAYPLAGRHDGGGLPRACPGAERRRLAAVRRPAVPVRAGAHQVQGLEGGRRGQQPANYLDAADDDLAVSFTESVEDVHVVVAGGIGQHSVWVPAFGYSHAATQRIDHPDGAAVLAG